MKTKKIKGKDFRATIVEDIGGVEDPEKVKKELMKTVSGDEDVSLLALDVRKHVFAVEGLREALVDEGSDQLQLAMSMMLMFMIEARNQGMSDEGREFAFEMMKQVEEQAAGIVSERKAEEAEAKTGYKH